MEFDVGARSSLKLDQVGHQNNHATSEPDNIGSSVFSNINTVTDSVGAGRFQSASSSALTLPPSNSSNHYRNKSDLSAPCSKLQNIGFAANRGARKGFGAGFDGGTKAGEKIGQLLTNVFSAVTAWTALGIAMDGEITAADTKVNDLAESAFDSEMRSVVSKIGTVLGKVLLGVPAGVVGMAISSTALTSKSMLKGVLNMVGRDAQGKTVAEQQQRINELSRPNIFQNKSEKV